MDERSACDVEPMVIADGRSCATHGGGSGSHSWARHWLRGHAAMTPRGPLPGTWSGSRHHQAQDRDDLWQKALTQQTSDRRSAGPGYSTWRRRSGAEVWGNAANFDQFEAERFELDEYSVERSRVCEYARQHGVVIACVGLERRERRAQHVAE